MLADFSIVVQEGEEELVVMVIGQLVVIVIGHQVTVIGHQVMVIGRQVMILVCQGVHMTVAEQMAMMQLAMAVMEVCSYFFTYSPCCFCLAKSMLHTFAALILLICQMR